MTEPARCDLGYIQSLVDTDSMTLQAQYGQQRLSSRFQPIFSLAHQQVVGYEGLIRAHDGSGQAVASSTLFDNHRSGYDEVVLDRLARYLHINNFRQLGNDSDWLFLNVSPRVVISGKHYGDYFHSLIAASGIDPRRVVIEIVEEAIEDEAKLAEATEYYRSMGCLIAIDDFGKGHSNFGRIWQLQPEVVKLDQSLIHQASVSPNSRRILARLISLLHESGSLVVIEGIETEQQALLAIDSGTDFVQGYYFARPEPGLLAAAPDRFHHLCTEYRRCTEASLSDSQDRYNTYRAALGECAGRMEAGLWLDQACESLLSLPQVKRSYVLDQEGWLVQQCRATHGLRDSEREKFVPLRRDKGMVWSQWREFLKAWQQGDVIYMGMPHLSLEDARLTRTLSRVITLQGQTYLLCCDVDVVEATEGSPFCGRGPGPRGALAG